MAVVEKDKTVQILYKVQTGTTSAGKPSYSTRTVSDINPTITAENAFNIGTAIAGLQKYTVAGVYLRNTIELAQQE
ncbi:DUF1659 domain-containing protein [Megamonas funiformis]|jgi:hypothetical protein|uniref:DUF1659 domain-containing protein n=1 Tax=Megamonas funiformis TaxID=437897 RepID=UPI000E3F3916|nr:DUF1659 domain-containing protein [Megamonas funiformis]RGJ93367.1 DUF1659 domain-containing protein [Megamonas funiformis]RGW41567.1 DUF1659 domain-containing protein [Megamonas funiformis]